MLLRITKGRSSSSYALYEDLQGNELWPNKNKHVVPVKSK
jgi:hypothetical protein